MWEVLNATMDTYISPLTFGNCLFREILLLSTESNEWLLNSDFDNSFNCSGNIAGAPSSPKYGMTKSG